MSIKCTYDSIKIADNTCLTHVYADNMPNLVTTIVTVVCVRIKGIEKTKKCHDQAYRKNMTGAKASW